MIRHAMACRYIKWMKEVPRRRKKQKIGESKNEGEIFTVHGSRLTLHVFWH